MKRAQVFTRSQHARVGRSGESGPDTYVAVVVRDESLPPLPEDQPLQRERLRRRGYTVQYLGEGYHRYTGPRSALGKLLSEADRIKDEVEKGA